MTDYTSSLKELLSVYILDDNIYNIINCSFMANDLQYIYLHLNEELSPFSIKIGSIIVALAFINSINIIFLLIVIYKNIKPKTSRLRRDGINKYNLKDEQQPINNEINTPHYNQVSYHDDKSNRNQLVEMSHLNLNQ